ncbi:dual specificity protein kinase kns1 [Ceratobasidium sp. 395]|nr:dual specificity protein kinase kns1 [Ceratobasidium sp. 395]
MTTRVQLPPPAMVSYRSSYTHSQMLPSAPAPLPATQATRKRKRPVVPNVTFHSVIEGDGHGHQREVVVIEDTPPPTQPTAPAAPSPAHTPPIAPYPPQPAYLTRYAASHQVSYPPPPPSSHASSTSLAPSAPPMPLPPCSTRAQAAAASAASSSSNQLAPPASKRRKKETQTETPTASVYESSLAPSVSAIPSGGPLFAAYARKAIASKAYQNGFSAGTATIKQWPVASIPSASADSISTRPQSTVCDDKEGYYIIKQDDIINGRCEFHRVVRLLGQEIFGKVVEATNMAHPLYAPNGGRSHVRSSSEYPPNAGQVVIKIVRAVPKYREASKIKIRVLKRWKESNPQNLRNCIHYLETFDHRNHICIVTHIQDFARSLFDSVAFLHDLQLIHTDRVIAAWRRSRAKIRLVLGRAHEGDRDRDKTMRLTEINIADPNANAPALYRESFAPIPIQLRSRLTRSPTTPSSSASPASTRSRPSSRPHPGACPPPTALAPPPAWLSSVAGAHCCLLWSAMYLHEIATNGDEPAEFVKARVSDGISPRYFGIQTITYTIISGIVIYCAHDATSSATRLARRIKLTVQRKTEDHWVRMRATNKVVDNEEGSGADGEIGYATGLAMTIRLKFLGGIRRQEMRELIEASEIAYSIWLRKTQDVPIPPVYAHDPDAWPVPYLDPFNSIRDTDGYDICIECQELCTPARRRGKPPATHLDVSGTFKRLEPGFRVFDSECSEKICQISGCWGEIHHLVWRRTKILLAKICATGMRPRHAAPLTAKGIAYPLRQWWSGELIHEVDSQRKAKKLVNVGKH